MKAFVIIFLAIIWPALSGHYYETATSQVVSFCETEYEAPVLIVEGVNVIKVMAQIATERESAAEPGQEMCKLIREADPDELTVTVEEETFSPGNYIIYINGYFFSLNSYGKIARPGEHGLDVGWGRWRD